MIDWDRWRKAYPEMTFAEQQAFYDRVYELHPEQARFSVPALEALLEHVDESSLVVGELGGWDGGFAAEILPSHPEIRSWWNFEISGQAVAASVCVDERYHPVVLRDWYWADSLTVDVFVASHVLEHLRAADVERVIQKTNAMWMYLQAPLADEPTDWTGYHGSHILEVGWQGVDEILERAEFGEIAELRRPGVRCYSRFRHVVR